MESKLLLKDKFGCPYLFLAPMEGIGDFCLRQAMLKMGGFDELTHEFIRVPINAHIKSITKVYDAKECMPYPFAAQIMGSAPELIAETARALELKGAPRIDLNCGCPSNTVTGKGAGSSLLKDPSMIYQLGKTLCQAVSVPVTIKMRSGYEDTALFQENLSAAEEAGFHFVTIHPRTKKDGYSGQANWELIALAKEQLKIPVVGNGDIRSVDDALKMLKMTKCDALMIGRGALINPWLFLEIRAHFTKQPVVKDFNDLEKYLTTFFASFPKQVKSRQAVNKLKSLFNYLFLYDERLNRREILRSKEDNPDLFFQNALNLLHNFFDKNSQLLFS